MGELYSLSKTAMGRNLELMKNFLSQEDMDVLDKMSNEEDMKDIEESILINSNIGKG